MRIDGRLRLGARLDVPRAQTAVIVTADKLATLAVPADGLDALAVGVPEVGALVAQVPEDDAARLVANQ